VGYCVRPCGILAPVKKSTLPQQNWACPPTSPHAPLCCDFSFHSPSPSSVRAISLLLRRTSKCFAYVPAKRNQADGGFGYLQVDLGAGFMQKRGKHGHKLKTYALLCLSSNAVLQHIAVPSRSSAHGFVGTVITLRAQKRLLVKHSIRAGVRVTCSTTLHLLQTVSSLATSQLHD
jgi:hypothetical protein